MKYRTGCFWGIVCSAFLILGVVAGVVLDRQVLMDFVPPAAIPAEAEPDFALMAEAWNAIQRSYVGRSEVEPRELAYGAISGMVDALGDTGHSRFLSPEMLEQERSATRGEFEGIGAEVQMGPDGRVVIVAPIDGSPAQSAGLQPGDVILEVDGESVVGLTLLEVVSRILGPAGTEVDLTVLHPETGATRDLTIERARISLQSVTWERLPGTDVAHVRISSFSQGVAEDLRQALSEIRQQGLDGIILDLRNNPGGLLDEAVGMTSQFLEEGNVLLEQNAEGEIDPVPVRSGGMATDIPLTVLINEGSASASEIVAGALQDAERATLVGETTFGTGTVLAEIPLSDGSAILLAIKQWLTPSGRVIWHQGISPDEQVALPPDATPLLPSAGGDLTPEELQAIEDTQLLRALELLESQTVP